MTSAVRVDIPQGPLTAFDERLLDAICGFEHLDAIVELRRLSFDLLAARCELAIIDARLRGCGLTTMHVIDGGGRDPRWE